MGRPEKTVILPDGSVSPAGEAVPVTMPGALSTAPAGTNTESVEALKPVLIILHQETSTP